MFADGERVRVTAYLPPERNVTHCFINKEGVARNWGSAGVYILFDEPPVPGYSLRKWWFARTKWVVEQVHNPLDVRVDRDWS